jgi:hypothetical protein
VRILPVLLDGQSIIEAIQLFEKLLRWAINPQTNLDTIPGRDFFLCKGE